MVCPKNTLHPKKQVNLLTSQLEPCIDGTPKERLKLLEQKEVIEDFSSQAFFPTFNLKKVEEKSVTVVCQPKVKKKTWKDKSNFSEENTQITKLLKILDQESTGKEKVLTPFWTAQSKEISKRLWLPIEIDCVDSASIPNCYYW